MKAYLGYIRVSTAKQGTHGVSLIEQKSAIERYAARTGLSIIEWFEERETAAKRGRPVFSRMLAALRKGTARGVIIHKIDRSARNLKDWADLGDLIDAGVDVHFAADALDLASRGGRLSADIQAVVAADYIRNLREETRKGFYGRLKQGLYPLGAPIGYLNQGGGKAKIPDPATAPFVRQAFELYATGRYPLHALRDELLHLGFRRPNGGKLHVSSLSHILNNPFYAGIIRLRQTGETFRGVHEPLISLAMFERTQSILKGKLVPRVVQHDFTYRRLFRCGLCGRMLIGERSKGHIYYRCHTRGCETTGIREERVEAAVLSILRQVELSSEEAAEAKSYCEARCAASPDAQSNAEAALALSIDNGKSRLDRLTDAFVDGLIEKGVFEERRASLIADIARLEEERGSAEERLQRKRAAITRTLELAENLVLGYELANASQRREILKSTTSNRKLCRKDLAIEPRFPFDMLQNRDPFQSGAPIRNTGRTREICQKQFLRAFIDRMFEDEASPNLTIPEPEPTEEFVQYDPAVYHVIQRKRQKHKDSGTEEEFDACLKKEARRLNRSAYQTKKSPPEASM